MSLLGAVPAAACAQAAVAAPPVRVEALLDAGAARVDYDEFLPSSLVSVGGLLRVDGARAGLTLRGSVARYGDTGNLNAQAGAAVGAFSAPWRGVRGEIGALVAAGHHQTVGGSGTGQLVARLHAGGPLWGGWAGGGVGWTAAGDHAAVARADLGAWGRRGPLRGSLSVTPTRTGRRDYADVVADARWTSGRLELGALAGVRAGEAAVATDLYPQARAWASADAVVWVARRVAATVAVGRVPSDPAAGSGGGRYVSFGMRLAAGGTRGTEPPRVLLPRATLSATPPAGRPDSSGSDAAPHPADGPERLAIVETGDGAIRLELDLPGARSAEIMGDVTDWEPRPLRRRADGRWEATLTLAPGVHRLNLRTDGGPWRVPPMLTAVDDGFGGRVGLLVVRR